MMRARTLGVAAPAIWHVDLASSSIYMERIDGYSVKHCIIQGKLQGPGACGHPLLKTLMLWKFWECPTPPAQPSMPSLLQWALQLRGSTMQVSSMGT